MAKKTKDKSKHKPVTYDRDFAKKVVALLLRDDHAAARILPLLKPEWVEDQILADVADVALKYLRDFSKRPTKLVLTKECGKDVMQSRAVRRLWRMDLSDRQYVLNHLIGFARKQAVKGAVVKCAEELKAGRESEALVSRLQEALATGTDLTDLGMSLGDLDSRIGYYAQGLVTDDLIPTGMEDVDRLMNGGLGPGELGLFMAPTGGGKSFALVNVAVNAVIGANRYKVLYITIELSEKKLLRRVDKLIAGADHKLLATMPRKFMKRLRRHHRLKVHGDLRVKFFPSKSLNTNQIKAYLKALEITDDFKPDMIVVDYLDEMRAVERYQEKRDQLAAIARDLRRLAGELQIPVWSATQANRAATSKKTIRKEDIGESYEKAQVADAIITICCTPEEYEDGRMRLFMAKMRDSASERTVQARFDFARGIIVTEGINAPVGVNEGRKKRRGDADEDARDKAIAERMSKRKRDDGGSNGKKKRKAA